MITTKQIYKLVEEKHIVCDITNKVITEDQVYGIFGRTYSQFVISKEAYQTLPECFKQNTQLLEMLIKAVGRQSKNYKTTVDLTLLSNKNYWILTEWFIRDFDLNNNKPLETLVEACEYAEKLSEHHARMYIIHNQEVVAKAVRQIQLIT